MPTNRITAIGNGQRAIPGDTALRLAHFFNTSAQFWLNLQSLYDLRRTLLKRLGFSERVRGSHHILTKEGIVEILNLQSRGRHAKPYQVKQVRGMIVNSRLAGDDDGKAQD